MVLEMDWIFWYLGLSPVSFVRLFLCQNKLPFMSGWHGLPDNFLLRIFSGLIRFPRAQHPLLQSGPAMAAPQYITHLGLLARHHSDGDQAAS
jgi:hypothetical protein